MGSLAHKTMLTVAEPGPCPLLSEAFQEYYGGVGKVLPHPLPQVGSP